MSDTFSTVFLAALILMIVLRFWLSARQIAHVRAHRDAVPQQFADRVSLAAHQKAADYTVARTGFARISLGVEILVLLGFTLCWQPNAPRPTSSPASSR